MSETEHANCAAWKNRILYYSCGLKGKQKILYILEHVFGWYVALMQGGCVVRTNLDIYKRFYALTDIIY